MALPAVARGGTDRPLLKACLNGARRPAEHPALPISPFHLARDTAPVVAAGADAVHVHVKDLDGADTFDSAATAAVLTAVRAAARGIPVGLTTGAWALPDPEARVAAVRSWTTLPDFASVNWHEDGADDVAAALLEAGVAVEAGLWHPRAVEDWVRSPHRDRCLRVLIELPDGLDEGLAEGRARRQLHRVERAVGDRIPVLLHGAGSTAWPALLLAGHLGLSARIGLEDVLTLPDGAPAPDNASLVRAAVRLLRDDGPDGPPDGGADIGADGVPRLPWIGS